MWWKQQDSEEKILYAALDVLAKYRAAESVKIKGRVFDAAFLLSASLLI